MRTVSGSDEFYTSGLAQDPAAKNPRCDGATERSLTILCRQANEPTGTIRIRSYKTHRATIQYQHGNCIARKYLR